VPNAFSPNGDGHNDRFYAIVPNLRQAELIIFNRWGEVLYRSFDLAAGWDGTFKEKPVQEGVYVFVVEGIGVDGSEFKRSGTITLIR
jgi:gliding motility-associated-like protein